MAEAIAVVGIAASIGQLIDLGLKVVHRLREYQTRLGDVPDVFRHVQKELPLLLEILQRSKAVIDSGTIEKSIELALQPIVQDVHEQIILLQGKLNNLLPSSDSKIERVKKALSSLAQESEFKKISSSLRGSVQTLTYYHTAAVSILQPKNDNKLARICQWLSAPDPNLNHSKAVRQHVDKTGSWFLNCTQYRSWKQTTGSFLWLYGIPGCGKTILSSSIIQDIIQTCDGDPGKAVAYFYCDFNDNQKQLSESIVRSVVIQFSQQCIKFPEQLEALYTSCSSNGRKPAVEELLTILHQMIQEFPTSYLILDALDECNDRHQALEILQELNQLKLGNLHVLVTSRREGDIESSLRCFMIEDDFVCLQGADVNEDIRSYIRHRWARDPVFQKRWKNKAGIEEEVEESLMHKADGMFRWAVCQLDELRRCINISQLRGALKTLPKTLDETYDRILCTIDENNSKYAVRILRWLAFSLRPLQPEEIAEVVAIDVANDGLFDEDEVLPDPHDVFTICSSLVTIVTTTDKDVEGSEHEVDSADENDSLQSYDNDDSRPRSQPQYVRLAHYSVKEYLVSDRIRCGRMALYSLQETPSHLILAQSCLVYLLRFRGQDMLSKEDFEGYALAHYSARFWIDHAEKVPDDEKNAREIFQFANLLFSARETAYINWFRLYSVESPWRGTRYYATIEDAPNSLYLLSCTALSEVVRLLISETENEVNVRGGRYGNALQAASHYGHQQVVKILLEAGAEVNAQGGYYGNALQAASYTGHQQVVKILLEAGAEVNAQGGYYGNALQAASCHGHQQTVKILLEAGAEVNAQGGVYGNALQAASCHGHQQVVKILLEAGAEVNAQGGHYGNALQAASYTGHQQVVKILLEAGAEVNAKGGEYGCALEGASLQGNEEITKLLLDAGAEVNLKGGIYGSALQAASQNGHERIVKQLLEAGADVNKQDRGYGSALRLAVAKGHERVAKILRDAGAQE